MGHERSRILNKKLHATKTPFVEDFEIAPGWIISELPRGKLPSDIWIQRIINSAEGPAMDNQTIYTTQHQLPGIFKLFKRAEKILSRKTVLLLGLHSYFYHAAAWIVPNQTEIKECQ